MQISRQHKEELGKLLAEGHVQFGAVSPRRPFRDKDDEGGGTADLVIQTHPLFANQPEGASSDLTFIATNNAEAMNEALDRSDELDPELKKRLEAKLENQYANSFNPKPSPY